MSGRLGDKVALVVGAGSAGEGWGNGKATAVLFARQGARIFAVDIKLQAVEETKAVIESEGGRCVAYQADATSADEVRAMAEACVTAFGRVDILHNNVGGSAPGGVVDMSEEAWDANLDLNLKSAFLTCKHVIPAMLRQGGGAIVNVGSIAGIRHVGERNMVAYQAAKAGLIQFTRAVALQYAEQGIRANCVIPGLMHTPLVEGRLADQYGEGKVQETIEQRNAVCPTGRMGDAWDVAYAALYLASDEAKYVTATEIVVDGGLTAKCG